MRAALRRRRAASGPLVGVSCLADGADQIFATEVISVGGLLEAVIPAKRYRDTLPQEARQAYDRLLERAANVRLMPYAKPEPASYMAAGRATLDGADELFAVWDGLPARGHGGTAEVVAHARSAGIPVRVLTAPIIPGLTDDPENLESVMRAAKEYGASFVGDNVLYLKPGTKEWFMPFLRETYPHLLPQYERFYRGAYAPRTYSNEVHAAVEELRERWEMTPRQRPQPAKVGQLALAI